MEFLDCGRRGGLQALVRVGLNDLCPSVKDGLLACCRNVDQGRNLLLQHADDVTWWGTNFDAVQVLCSEVRLLASRIKYRSRILLRVLVVPSDRILF